MTDIDIAKSLLKKSVTCALVKDGTTYVSCKRGIAPMLGFIEDGINLSGFSVADRIVGKAAAMLFVKAGVTEVYAEVLSEAGKIYLEAHGIAVSYGKLTKEIINRSNSGICPMESAVLEIDDYEIGYITLKNKVAELKKANI